MFGSELWLSVPPLVRKGFTDDLALQHNTRKIQTLEAAYVIRCARMPTRPIIGVVIIQIMHDQLCF
jgi:hypothetical protein